MLRFPVWLPIAGLFSLTFIAYIPAMQGGYIWDDDHYVHDNPNLRTADGLAKVWTEPKASPQYYPLVFTTFWLEHALWGMNPLGYHVVNVLLHSVSAILLFWILKRLMIPGAFLAAMVFAIHPVHVESVAWITERKNVLSGVFYLAAAYFYVSRFLTDREDATNRRKAGPYFVALGLVVCALLSKTVAASWPAAMLLIEWWKRGRIERASWIRMVPFFAIGLGAGLVTAWIERDHVGAVGPEFAFTIGERFLIAGRAVWFYLGKLLWPYPLSFIYPRWQLNTGDVFQIAWPVAAMLLVALLFAFRHRLGRGPLVTALFFGGTVLPALGFVNVYPMRFSFVADHFQYLASIGPIVLLSAAGAVLAQRSRVAGSIVAVGVAVTLGSLTWNQGKLYANEEHLWRETLARNPGAWIAMNNIGYAMGMRGELDAAILMLSKAVTLNPNFAEGQSNLGAFLLQRGNAADAIGHLQEAVRLEPSLSDAHGNLGVAFLHAGRQEDAIRSLREAVRLKGDNYTARYNLGCLLVSRGQAAEAVEHLEVAVRLAPDDAEAKANLEKARSMLKKAP
ncbi:MAG: tetratricopeptide repeat protein [Planctomycetes bacterium]|nr:tetratricopeptide repeat protein [Planctomycetota bacterium]